MLFVFLNVTFKMLEKVKDLCLRMISSFLISLNKVSRKSLMDTIHCPSHLRIDFTYKTTDTVPWFESPILKENCQYIEFMAGVIERGEAEEANDDGTEGERWYIPHHGVFHPHKTEKLRIVFDYSAKCKGICLNDHLVSGPDLTNNLTGFL